MRFLVLLAALALVAQFLGGPSALALSRDDLLQGCPVPERHAFSVNPPAGACQDFYHYACDDAQSFADAQTRLLYAKRRFFRILDQGYSPSNLRSRQLRNFYLACVNADSSQQEDRKDLQNEARAILAVRSRDELARFEEKRIDDSRPSSLSFRIGVDPADPRRYDLAILAEARALPDRSQYENPELKAAYESLAADLFRLLGISGAEERARWAVEFENGLAKISSTPSDSYLDRSEWIKRYPHLKLSRFLNRLPKNLRLRNPQPANLLFLDRAFEQRSLEELKSILLFKTLREEMENAYPEFLAKRLAFAQRFLGAQTGSVGASDRTDRCAAEVSERFPMELDEVLQSILFPGFSRAKITRLAESVRSAALDALTRNPWLSPDARIEADRKIRQLKLSLVKPASAGEWGFHRVGNYDPHHSGANRRLWKKLRIEGDLAKLRHAPPAVQWNLGPLAPIAYNDLTGNRLFLSQGILQAPFYDSKAKIEENFGGIGSIFGHELSHAIDASGSRYDADHHLRSWMAPLDTTEFKNRTAKLVDRFNRAGQNGESTLGENIGDLVGLSFAYSAAFPDPAKAVAEEEARFFLAYARNWCGFPKTDLYAAGTARVNEQVIDQPGFYHAFGCKEGDVMFLPEDRRIRVW